MNRVWCITRWSTVASLEMKGLPNLQKRIEAIGKHTPNVVAIALNEEAHTILADSVTNYAPHDTGHLKNTAKVELPVVTNREVSVQFGYGADYALAVHENPRTGVTGGKSPSGQQYRSWSRTGGWKYLEEPLKSHAPEVAVKLRKDIDAFVESLGDGSEVNVRRMPRGPSFRVADVEGV